MGKLMKYELYRRSKVLIIFALVLLFMEVAAIYGLYRGNDWLVLFIAMAVTMAFAAFIIPLLDAVTNYYSDFKNTHGYMLFLTPTNGFQFVGSKALFALAELVASVAVVAGFFVANFYLAKAFGYGKIIEVLEAGIGQISQAFGASTGGVVAVTVTTGILQYFNVIMLAITAVTLSKTLLSQKRFNWLIALLFYFALAMLTQIADSLVMGFFGFLHDIMRQTVTPEIKSLNMIKYMLIIAGLHTVWIGGGYTASSLLLSKRVDL